MAENSKRILVVDDESHIVNVVSLKLRNAGFQIITACDGEEAFELALQWEPDLVITDYQMPFMSGIDLCQTLRHNARTAHIPAIMLTARGFSIAPEQMMRTNILTVLSKPFSPREILNRVQELVGAFAER